MQPLIECVPNFSEGQDPLVIRQITEAIESVEGVRLLDVDPGKATNRTVVTFVGPPEAVVEAAFRGISKAAQVIDMSRHQGEHPRMGATDVCPLIPVRDISMEETAAWAHRLAERVGREAGIPVYLYEAAATRPERKNLADIREGEYEALPWKMTRPEWKPDYGPQVFHEKAGATVIGARDFLVAYNINLNTTSVRRANSVAFDVREKGRILREGDPLTGKPVVDEQGEPIRLPGSLKHVKAIGWYIEEYGRAQISMNLTNIRETPLHVAFDAVCRSAESRGMRVTGSEIVGMVPLSVLTDAGRHFLQQQQRSTGVSEEELVRIAILSLGLSELTPFDPEKKIIEYSLRDPRQSSLVRLDLRAFANETASESMAPGGGSISAYAGALGASLGTMVANLSSHKRGWDERWAYFSEWAEKGQAIKDRLLALVDEDTRAFNGIIDAMRLPKSNDAEKASRKAAIQAATRYAIEVPFRVMQASLEALPLLEEMAIHGNPNSVSDAAVGALCARAALRGAHLNVQINSGGLEDKTFLSELAEQCRRMEADALQAETRILEAARSHMK